MRTTLFVMRPHPKDFHAVLLFEHLVHEPMMDVDPSRVGSCEIANQLFIGRRSLERILHDKSQQCFGLASETAGG